MKRIKGERPKESSRPRPEKQREAENESSHLEQAMPRLSNIRHERFVRHYIKNGRASEAYRLAGFQPGTPGSNWVCASRLLRQAQVKSRIAELQRQMTYKTKVSVESLVQELDEARAVAAANAQAGAMVQATTTKAKLVGLMVERKESGSPGDFQGLQRAEILDAIAKKHGADVAALLQAALDRPEQAEMPEPESQAIN